MPQTYQTYACVICESGVESTTDTGSTYHCPRCGFLDILTDTRASLPIHPNAERNDPVRQYRIDIVSHHLRRMSDAARGQPVAVSPELLRRLVEEARLPSPAEQADNLVLWLGAQLNEDPNPAAYRQPNTGTYQQSTTYAPVDVCIWASIIGCLSKIESFEYVAIHLLSKGIIEDFANMGFRHGLRLTFDGWAYFEAIQRSQADSRRAFMAMKFNAPHLDAAFKDCFVPAVADAGFDLRRLDDGQGAGLIDDQLRVAIRTARFLIADLSTANAGAYWEAGFAEGLGKPVIYVCEDKAWNHEDKDKRPHFDTQHLVTVIWSQDDLPVARKRLAATIRNTFPSNAKMQDD